MINFFFFRYFGYRFWLILVLLLKYRGIGINIIVIGYVVLMSKLCIGIFIFIVGCMNDYGYS